VIEEREMEREEREREREGKNVCVKFIKNLYLCLCEIYEEFIEIRKVCVCDQPSPSDVNDSVVCRLLLPVTGARSTSTS